MFEILLEIDSIHFLIILHTTLHYDKARKFTFIVPIGFLVPCLTKARETITQFGWAARPRTAAGGPKISSVVVAAQEPLIQVGYTRAGVTTKVMNT